jgi:hypothetical protein
MSIDRTQVSFSSLEMVRIVVDECLAHDYLARGIPTRKKLARWREPSFRGGDVLVNVKPRVQVQRSVIQSGHAMEVDCAHTYSH